MEPISRRFFLSSAWMAANLPAIAAAQQHAHDAAIAPVALRFDFFTEEQAKDVAAIAEQIIPSDETGGPLRRTWFISSIGL